MNNTYLEKLEFHQIINKVNQFCCTSQGKELASTLVPHYQIHKVEKLLQETRRSGKLILS